MRLIMWGQLLNLPGRSSVRPVHLCPSVSNMKNARNQLHIWSLVIYLGWFVPDTISAVSGSSRFLTFVEQQQQQAQEEGSSLQQYEICCLSPPSQGFEWSGFRPSWIWGVETSGLLWSSAITGNVSGRIFLVSPPSAICIRSSLMTNRDCSKLLPKLNKL